MASRCMQVPKIALRLVVTSIAFCVFSILIFPLAVRCQETKMDVTLSYSFLRAYPNGNGTPFNSNGGSVAASWNFKPRVGIVGEFGGYEFGGQQPGVSGRLFTYAGGVRVFREAAGRRWNPFAQALAGGARVNGA